MIAQQQRRNGQQPVTPAEKASNEFAELGTVGLEAWSGYIHAAYNTALFWPSCEPLYSRIWRSDPETTIVRQLWAALAGKLKLSWELPETDTEPNDADRRAADFANSVLEDMDGGGGQWLQGALTRVPFYGFGVWERLAGVRRPNWAAPEDSGWRSQYDDGLVGIRRLAWRDYSAFDHWQMDDRSGRLSGMWQNDPPNPAVLLPIDRLLHVTYGDHDNPEGLATLEALWRLERLLYNKEIIQGIGFNHTAGHLSVTVEEGQIDKGMIQQAARSILTPQEGNYAAWPKGTTGAILDSSFSAAGDLEASIQNTRILKLALYGMQFVAISTMSGSGSYAALDDASSLAMTIFNSIAAGLVQQADDQLGRWLFAHPVNAAAFRGMTRRPHLTVSQVDKNISLTELGEFAQAMAAIMPLGDDDLIAIRTASGILPEELPEVEEAPEEPEALPEPIADGKPTDDNAPANIEATAGLNGAQITAVMDVLAGVIAGTTVPLVAIELLTAVGIAPERARRMVEATAAGAVPVDTQPQPEEDEEVPEDEELPLDELAEMAAGEPAEQVEDENDAYEEELAGLILAATDGDIGRAEFVRQANELAENWLLRAFKMGLGISQGGRLTKTQQAALDGQMEKQREAAESMAAEIYDAE